MKHLLLIGIAVLSFTACTKKNESTEKTVENTSTEATAEPNGDNSATTQPASVNEILAGYLKLKNALVKEKSKDAATAGDELVAALNSFDKSALTDEQKKTYSDLEEDAREHAEHIAENGGNIKHQREHFDLLSKDMYKLVKTFGADIALYYDHCPMYNDGKGANWLSETEEINNPYMGKDMLTCGNVKEELK